MTINVYLLPDMDLKGREDNQQRHRNDDLYLAFAANSVVAITTTSPCDRGALRNAESYHHTILSISHRYV